MSIPSDENILLVIDVTTNEDISFDAGHEMITIHEESNAPPEEEEEVEEEEEESIPDDDDDDEASNVEHEVITIHEELNVQLNKAAESAVQDIPYNIENTMITICEENNAHVDEVIETIVDDISSNVQNDIMIIHEGDDAQLDKMQDDVTDISVTAEHEVIMLGEKNNIQQDRQSFSETRGRSRVGGLFLHNNISSVGPWQGPPALLSNQGPGANVPSCLSLCTALQQDLVGEEMMEDILSDNEPEEVRVQEDNETHDEVEEIVAEDDLNPVDQNEASVDTKVVEASEPCDVFSFVDTPFQVTGAWEEFSANPANYTRGCKWSPDGSCILTCSDDNILRVFNCPSELWQSAFSWESVQEMVSVLRAPEGECIYDYAWYPLMSSYDPATCCFASTSKGSVVHLWDAFTGSLRCSYRSYNHLDEIVTPHSLAFDADGQKLFCGFNKALRIFDVSSPGRHSEERRLYNKKVGQAGIVSSFAFSPWYRNMSVVGSFSKTIGIYSEPSGTLEYILSGHQGGVTHMCFSPDGTKLFSGSRKDPEILCWDMRNLESVLFSVRRICVTNQRMYFDISKCGKYLVSGNQNGIVTVWDLTSTPKHISNFVNPILEPLTFFQAHNDCVNGISLHPTMPLFATSSGQRKFPEPVESDEESNVNECFHFKSGERDNSLRLWWASSPSEDITADKIE